MWHLPFYILYIISLLTPCNGLGCFSLFLREISFNCSFFFYLESKLSILFLHRYVKDWKWGWWIYLMCFVKRQVSGGKLKTSLIFLLSYCGDNFYANHFCLAFSLPWRELSKFYSIFFLIWEKTNANQNGRHGNRVDIFDFKLNSFVLTKNNYALVLIVRKICIPAIYQGPKMSQSHKSLFVSIQCRKSYKVYV